MSHKLIDAVGFESGSAGPTVGKAEGVVHDLPGDSLIVAKRVRPHRIGERPIKIDWDLGYGTFTLDDKTYGISAALDLPDFACYKDIHGLRCTATPHWWIISDPRGGQAISLIGPSALDGRTGYTIERSRAIWIVLEDY